MTKTAVILSAALAGLVFSAGAGARQLTKEECTEGSDFIKNAALSRDNGMDGMTFVAKVLADLAVIRSFPPELRWFAQDREDEDYLTRAVADVFENPTEPLVHQRNFYRQCLIRTASD